MLGAADALGKGSALSFLAILASHAMNFVVLDALSLERRIEVV
jgi:hypothetical protein